MMTMLNEEDLKKNVKDREAWFRFAIMVVLGGAFYITCMITFAVAFVQFFARLFSGAAFAGLIEFGDNIATYQAQLTRYLTFASDDKPFPFSSFPEKVKVEIIPPQAP